MASAGGGGGAGAGGAAGASAAAGAAAKAGEGPTVKVSQVEVIGADGNSQGSFGSDGKPVASNIVFESQTAAKDKGADGEAGVRLESLGKGMSVADVDDRTGQVVIRRSGRVVERFEDDKAAAEFAEKKKLSEVDRLTLQKLSEARTADAAGRAQIKASIRPASPELVNVLAAEREKGKVRIESEVTVVPSMSAAPEPAQGERDLVEPPSDDADAVNPAERAAMESIRARHASRRQAGAPVDAAGSTEMTALATADAADLMAIRSTAGLRQAAAELEDCLSDPFYSRALDAADLRTGKAMQSLHFDLAVRRMEEVRKEEARRRRGIFGVIVEEGQAVRDVGDGKGAQLTYYMKYVEDNGRTGTAWGEHLPAALRVAGAKIGDHIRFRWKAADEQVPDQPRFLLEVLEQNQLVADDAGDSVAQVSNSEAAAPPQGDQAVPTATGDDQTAEASLPQVESPEPASSANPQTPGIDARTMERLAAKRRSESAAARAAAGLKSDILEASSAKPIEADTAPAPTVPVDPIPRDPKGTKATTQQPAPPARPMNPMANGVTGEPSDTRPVPSEMIAKLLESVTYEMKGNGSVLYLVRGKAAFVDHGQQILMHDAGNEEDEAIIAAILLAKEKWGKVELTGSQAFKQRGLELIVKHNLDVQLKNPEQDAIRRQLAAASPAPAAPDESGPKPLMGTPRSPASAVPSTHPSRGSAPVVARAGHPIAAVAATSKPDTATTSPAPAVLASELAPIRARDWWTTQRAAITYWNKNRPAGLEADLAKLGPEPAPDQVFWFDKGGRRCPPPADAKAFAESLAASDANLKEINMANPKAKAGELPVLLRGVTKDGDEFRTTALLFKGKGEGNYLQGFIEAGGKKHHVIVHISERKPDADGVLRPNYLKVSERSGSGTEVQWKEIGYGNAVNHRGDGKVVHFDEVLFNVGQEVVKARVTSKVNPDMHAALGFLEARTPRSAPSKRTGQSEVVDPKEAPAAPAPEGSASANPVAAGSRRSPSARAAA